MMNPATKQTSSFLAFSSFPVSVLWVGLALALARVTPAQAGPRPQIAAAAQGTTAGPIAAVSPNPTQAESDQFWDDVIGRAHPENMDKYDTFDDYWQARRTSAVGKGFEAEAGEQIAAGLDAEGAGKSVRVTAAEGRGADAADIEIMDKKGNVIQRIQCKSSASSVMNALDDPKYAGMDILTSQESYDELQETLRKAKAKAARTGKPLPPDMQALDDAFKSGRILSKCPGGRPLPRMKDVVAKVFARLKQQFEEGKKARQAQRNGKSQSKSGKSEKTAKGAASESDEVAMARRDATRVSSRSSAPAQRTSVGEVIDRVRVPRRSTPPISSLDELASRAALAGTTTVRIPSPRRLPTLPDPVTRIPPTSPWPRTPRPLPIPDARPLPGLPVATTSAEEFAAAARSSLGKSVGRTTARATAGAASQGAAWALGMGGVVVVAGVEATIAYADYSNGKISEKQFEEALLRSGVQAAGAAGLTAATILLVPGAPIVAVMAVGAGTALLIDWVIDESMSNGVLSPETAALLNAPPQLLDIESLHVIPAAAREARAAAARANGQAIQQAHGNR